MTPEEMQVLCSEYTKTYDGQIPPMRGRGVRVSSGARGDAWRWTHVAVDACGGGGVVASRVRGETDAGGERRRRGASVTGGGA